jgi:ABC-type Fe3+/spermidine/putrescine transport system ATPase subunit
MVKLGATVGLEEIGKVFVYFITVVLALLFHACIVYPSLLKTISGLSPRVFLPKMNLFAADFIGKGTIINVAIDAAGLLGNNLGSLSINALPSETGNCVKLLVRPDDIAYDDTSDTRLSIVSKSFLGPNYLYELALEDDQRVPCLTHSHIDIPVGDELPVRFDLRHVVIFNAE